MIYLSIFSICIKASSQDIHHKTSLRFCFTILVNKMKVYYTNKGHLTLLKIVLLYSPEKLLSIWQIFPNPSRDIGRYLNTSVLKSIVHVTKHNSFKVYMACSGRVISKNSQLMTNI